MLAWSILITCSPEAYSLHAHLKRTLEHAHLKQNPRTCSLLHYPPLCPLFSCLCFWIRTFYIYNIMLIYSLYSYILLTLDVIFVTLLFICHLHQNCSIAVCLEFRCNSFMIRDNKSRYNVSGNVRSGWIEQVLNQFCSGLKGLTCRHARAVTPLQLFL